LTPEHRADLLRKTLCGATLLMVVLSWPLWIDLADFPAVPFVGWFPDYPRHWSWLGLVLIVAGLGLGMTRRLGKVGVGLTVVVMTWLILGDQLRFQPWVYQFLILGTLLIVLPPGSVLGFGRVWMASVYFHSGLSKLDTSFALGMGPLFVRTLLRVLGVSALPRWLVPTTAVLLPAAEIVVALFLLVSRTRRLGYLGALTIHAALLLILGPWGLGHSTIVLVWNVALAVEEFLLFWPKEPLPPLSREDGSSVWGGPPCPPEGAHTRRPGTSAPLQKPRRWTVREKLVALPLAALLVLPFGERAGLFDSWPSHALYADHCERTTVHLRVISLPADFPPDLRVAMKPNGNWSWLLSPTDWSRRVRGVPAYPQIRYTNALAEWIGERIGDAPWTEITIVHRLRADPRTGQAKSLSARDLNEARALSDRFWFNAHPRDRSGP
jgi:hypothetical protein